MSAALWPALLFVAIAWPSRALGLLDGLPLNGRTEALLFGVVVPALVWFDRRSLQRAPMRIAIVALLAVKLSGLLLTPQGLCARFSTTAPFVGETHTIPISEPEGWLRSWDVRANWRDRTPACTAIVDRAYPNTRSFPAWFVNLLDSIRPGRTDLKLDLNGYVTVRESGVFSLPVGDGMRFDGSIGDTVLDGSMSPISVPLTAGAHAIALHASLTGDQWQLQPRWNDADAWSAATFTTAAPGSLDRAASIVGGATTVIGGLLIAMWLFFAIEPWRAERALLAWSVVASAAFAIAATMPSVERIASIALIAAAAIPVAHRHRNLRAAFLLIGAPWLAFFAVRAIPEFGLFTGYSHDDWLAYQVAGYRIFMGGYWLEGGNAAFDYQPLYRWISGALHFVFGDSSAGEIIVDAASLLCGSLLAFSIVKAVAGFRWGVAAGAAVLMTFATGTTWYFVGRGLSETVASGFGFAAGFLLLRGRLARPTSIVAAGVCAGLMFYTRMNFLIIAAAMAALLMPLRIPTVPARVIEFIRQRARIRLVVGYASVIATSVVLFMTRTWWFTGHFSALYGTSLKNNDIGLRWNTVADAAVWSRIRHSIGSLILMNEPPQFDARAIFVIAGTVFVVLAAIQVPVLRKLPASLVLVTLATMISAFFVHTHNYPGRMSIPLVPFACASAVAGAWLVTAGRAS